MIESELVIAERLQQILQTGSVEHLDVRWGDAQQTLHYQFDCADHTADQSAIEARRYLVASLTKPIVAMGAVKLAAEGAFSLNDRIGRYLPAFNRSTYRRITIRNLLTHTSGLPDMLPDNTELRSNHASLAQFVEHAAEVDLEFPSGSDSRYSSVGLLLLGRLMESVTQLSLPGLLRQQFFDRLQMQDSWLGLPAEQADPLLPTVFASVPPNWQSDAADWGWNSRYWRTLGAPWGGLISSAADLGAFAQMMLNAGQHADQAVLPAAAVCTSVVDRTSAIVAVSSTASVQPAVRPWGFGWRMQWETHAASFGDFWSSAAYGHWGATGTMMCIDPQQQRFAVILTTTPYEESRGVIQQIANVLACEPIHDT